MSKPTRDTLEHRIVAALDTRAADLDAATLGRLAAARRAAMARSRSRLAFVGRSWQTVGALALAASAVFGISLWLHAPAQGPAPLGPAELEMLAEDEELELLEKLEFYRWLEQESHQLAGNGHGGNG